MGNLTSRTWQEMTELQQAEQERHHRQRLPRGETADSNMAEDVKENRSLRQKLRTRILRTDPRSATDGMERTPIAVAKTGQNTDTPVQVETKMKRLSLDPRSPGGLEGVERTPILVEDSVRRRVLDDDCCTPVRGQVPAAINLGDRSPFIIETEEAVDPRSPSLESPRTPITSTPAIDLLPRHSTEHSTPQTIDLHKLEEQSASPSATTTAVSVTKRADKGQPSRILQDRLKSAVANMQETTGGGVCFTAPPAAGDLDDSETSMKSGNDSSLVI